MILRKRLNLILDQIERDYFVGKISRTEMLDKFNQIDAMIDAKIASLELELTQVESL